METFSPEERLNEIWKQGRELGLTDSEICHLLTASVQESHQKEPLKVRTSNEHERWPSRIMKSMKVLVKSILFSLMILVIFGLLISTHNPTRKFVTRHIQDCIYPFMTRLRQVSLPLLNKYPSMTSWYSEECLIENPFFDQVNVDCNICSKNSELEIVTNTERFSELYYNKGRFVVIDQIPGNIVPWNQVISKIDISSEKERGALKTISNHMNLYSNLKEYLSDERELPEDIHIEWKVNKLEALHVLRKLLPRFSFIPADTEVSLHHMVFIDGPEHKSYPVPISEFANVVLFQGEGSSIFSLEPSAHCKRYCQAVTVTLNSTQMLFFNWIFWRPIRISGDGISTLFLSSFY